jgi:hypothetical protein
VGEVGEKHAGKGFQDGLSLKVRVKVDPRWRGSSNHGNELAVLTHIHSLPDAERPIGTGVNSLCGRIDQEGQHAVYLRFIS